MGCGRGCRRPEGRSGSAHRQGEHHRLQQRQTRISGRGDSEPSPRERRVRGQYVSEPTGSGKSWLACALAQYACRRGQSALYLRVPRLAEELRILHGNGGFTRWLAAVARTDVLLLDDWALAAMDGPTRADLMEVIDDRAGTRATIITSQLPVEHWHAWIGDATIADAILDRLLSRSHRLALKGKSLRTQRPGAATANADGSATTDAAH